MYRTLRAALAVLAVLALGACTPQDPEISVQDQVPAAARTEAPAEEGDGGDGGGQAEGEPVTWVAVDVEFAEAVTELPADTPIALTLDGSGANLPHDITIEELGSSPVVATEGGETATATITLEAGTYTFYCSVPGHRNTMEETVTVG